MENVLTFVPAGIPECTSSPVNRGVCITNAGRGCPDAAMYLVHTYIAVKPQAPPCLQIYVYCSQHQQCAEG